MADQAGKRIPLVLCRIGDVTEYALGVGREPLAVEYYLRVSTQLGVEQVWLFREAYHFGYGRLSAAKKARKWLEQLDPTGEYFFPEGVGLEEDEAVD